MGESAVCPLDRVVRGVRGHETHGLTGSVDPSRSSNPIPAAATKVARRQRGRQANEKDRHQ